MIGNENRKYKLIKSRDLILVLVCILAAAFTAVFIFKNNNKSEDFSHIAVIKYDNKEIYRIDLNSVDEPYYIPVENEYNTKILVEKGKISFKENNCPDKICISAGKISQPGQVAVCMPAKLIIEIIGGESIADAVTG